MRKGRIIIMSGPSGSGKTTLHKTLLNDPRLKGRLVKSISVTTRSPRPGEKNGRDYIFLTKKQFLYKKRAGHFLESQKVFDSYYGTPNKNVRDLMKQGKDVLLCIDVKGAKVAWRKHPEALKVFITTPSPEVLEARLRARGTEDEAVLALRLATARKELKEARMYDHVIVNDNLPEAAERLAATILAARPGA